MILELNITERVKFPSSSVSAESIHIVNTRAENENVRYLLKTLGLDRNKIL